MDRISCLVFYTVVKSIVTSAEYIKEILKSFIVPIRYFWLNESHKGVSPHIFVLIANFSFDPLSYFVSIQLKIVYFEPSVTVDVAGSVFN